MPSTSTMLSTGSRSSASTGCASTPSTRSSIRARPTSWSSSPVPCGPLSPRGPSGARERAQPCLVPAARSRTGPPAVRRAVERRPASCHARAAHRRAARLLCRLRRCAVGAVAARAGRGLRLSGRAVRHQSGGSRAASLRRDLPPLAFVDFLQNHDQIGNRALGERLSRLVAARGDAGLPGDPAAQPASAAAVHGRGMGQPQPHSSTSATSTASSPQAVRDGRRREFAAFFDDVEEIPDPLDEATFMRARASTGTSSTSRTMRLARPHSTPPPAARASKSRPDCLGDDVRVVHIAGAGDRAGCWSSWRLATAAGSTLLANLGDRLDRQPWDPAGEPAATLPTRTSPAICRPGRSPGY